MLSIWIICLFSMFTKSGKLDFFCSSMVLGQSFVKFERIYWIVLGFDMKRMPLLFLLLLPLLHFHSFSLYSVLFALPSHLPFLSPFPIPFPPDYLSPFPSPFLFPPLLCPLSLFPFPLSRFPIPCPPHSLSSHIYMCALNKIVKYLIIRITVIIYIAQMVFILFVFILENLKMFKKFMSKETLWPIHVAFTATHPGQLTVDSWIWKCGVSVYTTLFWKCGVSVYTMAHTPHFGAYTPQQTWICGWSQMQWIVYEK